MNKGVLLGALLLASALLGAQAGLSFEAERIDFSLRSTRDEASLMEWEVRGVYSFSNCTEQSLHQLIAFPIPAGDGLCTYTDLVLNKSEGDPEASCELISKSEKGISFGLSLPPLSFISILISYRQRVTGKTASYILQTANSWAQPLPSAIYSLYVENGIELKSISLTDPLILNSRTGIYYFWEFRNYRPEQDFVLHLK
ncbi:MAG TPA: hypothetical protein P5533_03105 [Candidatus Cloacimonadota bacterium]|nr:hypothetical protein [Candidatus Cloacimonadota bacterium]